MVLLQYNFGVMFCVSSLRRVSWYEVLTVTQAHSPKTLIRHFRPGRQCKFGIMVKWLWSPKAQELDVVLFRDVVPTIYNIIEGRTLPNS